MLRRVRLVYRPRCGTGAPPPSEAAARPPTVDHDAGRSQAGGATDAPTAFSGADRSSGSASSALRVRAAGSAGRTLRATSCSREGRLSKCARSARPVRGEAHTCE